MRRVNSLFGKVVDLANLYDSFRGASAGKRDQPEVRAFEFHLETNLWAIRRDLEAGNYPWGAYRRFRIHDPKEREIRAAPFRDRVVAPLSCRCDFLGYVHFGDGRSRIRRRSGRRMWRRLPALQRRLDAGQADPDAIRSSIASWFGLAAHADAFRLSRSIFRQRDVENIGKRLLFQRLAVTPRGRRTKA
jgi:hypothetical protein